MNHRFQFLSVSPGKAATIVAFSLISLTAFAASQPGGVAAVPSPATAAHSTPAVPAEDILDIRGPIHIPAPFPWLAWTGGALAAAGLGLGAWTFFRRPRRKLPYEIALEKLAATRPLMERDSAQPFSLAVSEIVRRFIEESFPVRAAHRTTNEFLHDLVNLPESPLAAHQETLGDFLRHCDLAKFACWSLTRAQMEAMLASASAFVIAIGKPKPVKKPPTPTAATTVAEPATAHS
jgi:hypothetical protein